MMVMKMRQLPVECLVDIFLVASSIPGLELLSVLIDPS